MHGLKRSSTEWIKADRRLVFRRLGAMSGCVGVSVFVVMLLMQSAGAAPAVPATTGAVSIPHPLTMLLRDAAVRSELALGPEQISAVETALERVELPLWQLRDVPPAEGGESVGRLVEELREELASVLSARQNERLNELVLQALGVAGLLDPGVVERLRLSPGQVGKIRDTVNTLRQDLAALQQSTRGAHQLAQVRAIQAKADQTVVSLLDRRQRVKLKGLMGPGFDLTRVRQAACRAPELRGVNTWVNADAGTLEAMRGQVVVVHFYTFGCINCVRNLPHYVAWQKHFAARPVRMVGIHRPETQGERIVETVRKKAAEAGLKHPIAIDNDSENWDAWANRVWPSVYLVDRKGFVRYWWYGELNWQGIEGERWMRGKIEELLWEER